MDDYADPTNPEGVPDPREFLHDPEAARAAIAEIRALDLTSCSVDQVVALLIPVFRGYVVSAPRFEQGLTLFRAQAVEKPSNVRRLLYPPPEVARLGRVNRPGTSVLYCSTSRQAPFFELKPDPGATVALAQWKTTAPLLLNHVGYRKEAFRLLRSNRSTAGWASEPPANPGGETSEAIADFLAELFTQDVPMSHEHLYKVTVAVAEKLFSDRLFNGLIYPTVAMRANADNLALKPQYADQHLQFVKAEFARVDAVRDFAFDVTVLDTATEVALDGSIRWRGHADQWTLSGGEELSLTAEGGRWVARDQSGRVVEPN